MMSDEGLVFRRYTAKAEIRPLVYRLGFGNSLWIPPIECRHVGASSGPRQLRSTSEREN